MFSCVCLYDIMILYKEMRGGDSVDLNRIEIVEMGRYLLDSENFFLEYNEAEVYISPHLHRFIEIELITEGSGYEEIDGRIYEIEKGDITIMLPDEVHSFVSRNNDSLIITSIKVSPYYLPENVSNFVSSVLLKGLPADEYALICQLCSKLHSIQQGKDRQNMAALSKECVRMIFLLCQTHLNERMPVPIEMTESDRYRRALLYIHKNFRRNLTVAEVAAEVYLVPDYFSTYFEKKMGMSCSRYINKLRMELAREYIAATDMSLKEIVYKCGFNSFSYFSSVFKKYYGCSPGAFRKSGGNMPCVRSDLSE